MNERIKELAKKVDPELGKETIYCTANDLEKFAELIVRECVKIAHPKLNDVGEWAAGMRLVQKRLKEHFGVEE